MVTATVVILCGCGDRKDGAAQQGDTVDRGPDPALNAAREALDDGLSWTASLRIAPVLADTARRTPEAEIIAARAAAGWGGWDRVRDLLQGRPWLDTLFDGRGRELLARAALRRREFGAAVPEARSALRASRTREDSAVRTVLLARAFDGNEQPDSARALYLASAELFPSIADWLVLRAMVLEPDSARRADRYGSIAIAPAVDHVALTEARATLRAGDTTGAIRAQRALGRYTRVAELQLARARNRADSAAIRDSMMDRIGRASRPPDGMIDLLTRVFGKLPAKDELTIARTAAAWGPADRAISGFARAFEGGQGTSRDRWLYGNVLARIGRYDDAAAQYGRVTGELAPDAAYLRARSILRAGNLSSSRTELRNLLRRYPDDAAAVIARVLLADLAIDEGRDDDARETLLATGRTAPRVNLTPSALFSAAIIAYAHGEVKTAATEFDSIVARYPDSDAALSARYWAGRAWERAGDSARARERWRDVLKRYPYTYYATRSGRRLGVPLTIPAGTTTVEKFEDITAAMARSETLDSLGLEDESLLELDDLGRRSGESTERLLATATAFSAHDHAARALQLATRALGRGAATDTVTYRLLFPVLEVEGLLRLAREHGADPALVAGLIRQESTFNPRATSGAGARGLMQVMPQVGEQMARSLHYPVWDPVLLYQPSVSLQMGIQHLSELQADYPDLPHVLAAYNAGRSRVERWENRHGVGDDPELFTERIPFRETRDYVRLVIRNMEIYRALYGWGKSGER